MSSGEEDDSQDEWGADDSGYEVDVDDHRWFDNDVVTFSMLMAIVNDILHMTMRYFER